MVGSTNSEVSSATSEATTPPYPRDRRKRSGKTSSVASEAATVIALNRMVWPARTSARRSASPRSGVRARSSGSGREAAGSASPVDSAAAWAAPASSPRRHHFCRRQSWFVFRLGDEPQYLATYLPGQLLGGAGLGLMLPAFTALAVSTLPPGRLVTGIAWQTAFRQIGAAVGLTSFVAIVGTGTLATKNDFDGPWLFMTINSAGSGIVLFPLFGRRRSANASPISGPPSESPTRARPHED
jgi:hypothetical protein